jgi:membrane fusion protein (multidrug efflux system)
MARTCSPSSLIPTVLLLAAALALSACSQGTANDSATEPAPVAVEVARTSRGPVAAAYTGTAAIEVDEEATVAARVAGEIVELMAEEGDSVKAGQVLARLDGDRLRLELREARANLGRLERDFERNVELHRRGLISSEANQILQFELEAMQAVYERRALEYEYTSITAPIDGIVAHRYIRVGNTINAGDATFHITSRSPLLAYLYVPEREFARLVPGQRAEVRIDALAGLRLPARVQRISPVVDAATGTFRVTVEIPDPEGRLRPGMFARLSVIYEQREDALLVPRSALLDGDGGDAVFVVSNGTARRQQVRLGFSSGDRVEIIQGLADDDQVVVVGQNGLRDGASIRVIGNVEG